VDVHDAVTPPPPDLPEVVLEEMVSRTNLSEVWRGKRRGDGMPMAVKFATSPASAEALEPEAETVCALEEAGVRGIVHAQYSPFPVPHIVFPWMGRSTFRDTIQAMKSGDDRSRAVGTFLRVVETVAAVHSEQFMHGDLKPENILVDDRGQPWLTDFGMARAIRSARLDSHVSRSMDQTEDGWGGTLHYLPPEGMQGEAPTRSWDVYALGVILHEILLGRRPDRGATPETLRTVLPGQVVDVLLRALAYSPDDRFASAVPLNRALEEIRFELTATGPVRWALRCKRLALAGFAAFFVGLRYTSVFALLAGYAAILVLAFSWNPGVAALYLCFLLLHLVIRWEGPESPEEARLRKQGTAAWRR